jgi:hypothetical protein
MELFDDSSVDSSDWNTEAEANTTDLRQPAAAQEATQTWDVDITDSDEESESSDDSFH